MGTAYFLDTENVGIKWIRDYLHLEDRDELFIVRNSQLKIPFNVKKKHIHVITIEIGHNSADILISGIIGSLLGMYDSFVIVSNDRGYDSFIKYFENKYDIQRMCVSEMFEIQGLKKAKINNLSLEEEKKDYILQLVEKYQYVGRIKQAIYQNLCKKYGQDEGLKLYTSVKRYLK